MTEKRSKGHSFLPVICTVKKVKSIIKFVGYLNRTIFKFLDAILKFGLCEFRAVSFPYQVIWSSTGKLRAQKRS